MVKQVLHIRRANTEDAQLVAELSDITFFDTFKGTCTDDDLHGFIKDYFGVEQVAKELQDDEDFYFIAYLNKDAVGYIRMREDKSDVDIVKKHKAIKLKRIYVLKEHHLKKIGAALMSFALDFAAEKEYQLIWLSVWEHNEKAKTFYKKFGFEDSGFSCPFPIGSTPQTDLWWYKFIEKID